jgi:hypothetical protein
MDEEKTIPDGKTAELKHVLFVLNVWFLIQIRKWKESYCNDI